ncbi:MAG: nicotinate (nicotinamide) nucleotide adenylyltransferase [Planctomycetaceae bacterium]|jgi:nicotinate-nucleotide adenylyltransferase|nr:nicotinate (nicotinamide) nucleotide adenylyltransferase [Planctomycetaceae bacterium]
MRYGIYGGAFDPIHRGHLLLAEHCLHEINLDRVIFVPTGISPHRISKNSYTADAQDRYNMVSLAISGYKEFEVSRFEIDRETTSYTVDTLRYFHSKFSNDNNDNNNTEIIKCNYCNEKYCDIISFPVELFLIMGSDMFCDLPNWYEFDEIIKLAVPLVALRRGSQLPKTGIRYISISMPIIDISSTRIRSMLINNILPDNFLPDEVLNYIKVHKLYLFQQN